MIHLRNAACGCPPCSEDPCAGVECPPTNTCETGDCEKNSQAVIATYHGSTPPAAPSPWGQQLQVSGSCGWLYPDELCPACNPTSGSIDYGTVIFDWAVTCVGGCYHVSFGITATDGSDYLYLALGPDFSTCCCRPTWGCYAPAVFLYAKTVWEYLGNDDWQCVAKVYSSKGCND